MKKLSNYGLAPALPGREGTKWIAALVFAALTVATAYASDPVGIYALVDKVVLEPNDEKPERIQIWGAFSFAEGRDDAYRPPAAGYLYYKLNPEKPDVCKKEWADLKAVAGTNKVIAFGSRRGEKGKVRLADSRPAAPDVYPLGFGLQKIRDDHWNAGPVKALRAYATDRKKTAALALPIPRRHLGLRWQSEAATPLLAGPPFLGLAISRQHFGVRRCAGAFKGWQFTETAMRRNAPNQST